MAKGGAFNVSQLIRELGLQTISGDTMRVLETIQPTISVGDLGGLTPPHVTASAFFDHFMVGSGGLFGTVEVQCLSPGGLFIDWITYNSTSTSDFTIRSATALPGGTIETAAGVTSRDPLVSIVRSGNVARISGNGVSLSRNGDIFVFGNKPIFVPRGQFFGFQVNTADTSSEVGFSVREVPASEHVPA